LNIPREEEHDYAQNIIDTIREALIVLNEHLRVLSASRSFYRQFKTTREQTEGRLIYELGDRQWDIPELHHLLESIIPEQITIEDFEVQHCFESIGEKIMLLNARRVIREQGKPAFILLAIEDITERITADKLLRESEKKFRKFVEEINSIIIGFDREGRITFFNHFSEKLFGYHRKELIGKPIFRTIFPCTDSSGKSNAPDCDEIFTDPARYYENESEGMHKDGHRIWISWSAKAVHDNAGIITEILIDGNDITDLYRQRKSERERLRGILDNLGSGVILLDKKGTLLTFNKTVMEWYGYSHESEMWEHSSDYITEFDLSDSEEKPIPFEMWPVPRAINGEYVKNFEVKLTRKRTGDSRWISFTTAPIYGSVGEVIHVLVSLFDITERKYAEEQIRQKVALLENANKELEKFNRIAVEREMRMIELKREINALCNQLGESHTSD
jgi:PAS domain S-box-containing protein